MICFDVKKDYLLKVFERKLLKKVIKKNKGKKIHDHCLEIRRSVNKIVANDEKFALTKYIVMALRPHRHSFCL